LTKIAYLDRMLQKLESQQFH